MVDPSSESLPDPPPADPISAATLLRQARERRGLTLEQVAQETKIPLERLAALEQDGLAEGNSSGFYHRARMRAYARAVGLDERLLPALTIEAPPAAPTPARQSPPARQLSSRGQHILTLVACGVVVAGFTMVREGSDRTRSRAVSIAPPSQLERRAVPTTGITPAAVQTAPLLAQLPSPVAAGESVPPEAEARPQPTTTAAPTELVITTEPGDARVAVNGIGWGSTPITILHLSPGEKRIRVTKSGYVAVERVARVVADRSTALDIQLQPAP